MNIFLSILGVCLVLGLVGAVFLTMFALERTERNTKICSDHGYEIVVVNRGNTVLCVDPENGEVFYLR